QPWPQPRQPWPQPWPQPRPQPWPQPPCLASCKPCVRGFSLSKTKNVAKLTSEISSSPRVISCAAGPTVAAGVPLASDNDNPAAPNNGTAQARCFRFEACSVCDIVEFFPIRQANARPSDRTSNATPKVSQRQFV